ncbi:MAG: sialate O-acetylesterase [Pirellulaceae bacterium]
MMIDCRFLCCIRILVVASLCVGSSFGWTAEPVKVFILAGQSNMEGKAKLSLLEHQIHDPRTAALFEHLHENGQWTSRNDVWIKFLDRHGELTVGFGSPNCMGPELEFGHTVGNHCDAQVLLIKTAWGGKSLFRDFRPPSAGLPDEATLNSLLEAHRRRHPDATLDDIKLSFGESYRKMLAEVHDTLGRLSELFPQYQGQGYEIAGLVWFQGWNDMINDQYTAEYTDNLVHLIRDVRRDLQAPNLPVVIGQLGVDGVQDSHNAKRQRFKDAQAAAANADGFAGNVAVVKTDELWDQTADAVFRKGWKEHLDEWNTVGSDYPYHYLGSAVCYSRIGKAFGEAMIRLIQPAPASDDAAEVRFYDPVERNVEGWTVKVDPQLLEGANQEIAEQALVALANHLQRIRFIVPQERLTQLQKLPIWLELENTELKAMQYHPDRGWLLAHGHDPRLVKHVHIPIARQLVDARTWAKHPYVILHELAHAYHDQVLGFDHADVKAVFDQAEATGKYESVLLYTGQKVRHYGLSNHKEFFAEATEAYFGVNDFYPFVRAELEEFDPNTFKLMQTVWGEVRN